MKANILLLLTDNRVMQQSTSDIIIKDKEDNPIYVNQNMIPLNLQPLETSRLERQVLIILVEELQGMMKA
jgi:hypothetical protein